MSGCIDMLTEPSVKDAAKAISKALLWVLPLALGTGWYWQMRSANKQRVAENCAAAVKSLYKLREMPYRIRRRTSDEPETLAALAGQFHDLQEEVDYWIAWSATRDGKTAAAFEEAATFVRRSVGPFVDDAWTQPFVNRPADMVLKNSDAGLYKMGDVDNRIQALLTKLR